MNVFCVAGKKALLDAVAGHIWKAALYTAQAKLNALGQGYTAENEVRSGDGYFAGGVTLTGAAIGEGFTTAWMDFDDPTWPQARFTARYMMIYDASDANKSYAIIDFGTDKTGQGGNFTAQLPEPDALNAIIRI